MVAEGRLVDDQGACQRAAEILDPEGERWRKYGDPVVCYRRVGALWGHILGTEAIPADKVALMMIAFKLGREINGHNRDNLIDICGYAEIADLAHARR